MSEVRFFSQQELMDLDMGTVKGKVNRTLLAGTYLFIAATAGVNQGENKDTGQPRLETIFMSKAAAVIQLDDPTANPADYVDQAAWERFYAPTPDNVGYTKTYFDNVLGAECKMKFSEMMALLDGRADSGHIMFQARIDNSEWNGRLTANLSRDPNHFVGFEQLSDELVAQGKAFIAEHMANA